MIKKSTNFFLNDFSNEQDTIKEINNVESSVLKCYCWNVCNPSLERARKQVEWLKQEKFDILLLTETKNSEGCNYIEKYFKAQGYHIYFPKPEGSEYGIIFISKFPFKSGILSNNFSSSRIGSIQLTESLSDLEILGTYIPNNREKGKQDFIQNISKVLSQEVPKKSFIFCGDFNILEPDHVPHYSKFEDWEYGFYNHLKSLELSDAFRVCNPDANEYSWVGRTGEGYRYDHCFVSKDLVLIINNCYYNHEPRINKLSDHSCLIITLSI
jgi:exodeoxyribonuclease-3